MPRPTRATAGDQQRALPHRLVLASIGTGGFAHLPVLRKLTPGADAVLARLLLQAPSELALLDSAEAAGQVADMLAACGLRAEVQPAAESFRPGRGEFDVALFIQDVERAGDIIDAVRALLGVSARAAADIVCASPPVLLGKVSRATVEALRERFEALGGSLAASATATARYDLIVHACPPRVRSHLLSPTYPHAVSGADSGEALIITDLSRAEAEQALAELSTYSARAAVVDRAFERFDIKLDACPATAKAEQCLIALTGMPAPVAARVASNTPIILASDLTREDATDALARLTAVGAMATAEMITFHRYAVRIEQAPGRAAVGHIISLIIGENEPIGPFPRTIDRAMTLMQARWMVHELTRAGARAEVLAP